MRAAAAAWHGRGIGELELLLAEASAALDQILGAVIAAARQAATLGDTGRQGRVGGAAQARRTVPRPRRYTSTPAATMSDPTAIQAISSGTSAGQVATELSAL